MATLVETQRPVHNPSHQWKVPCQSSEDCHSFCHLKDVNSDEQLDFCNKHTKVSELKELRKKFWEAAVTKDSEIALEEDGTIVGDDDYLESLPEETVLRFASSSSDDELDASSLEADSADFDNENGKVFQTAVKKLENNLGAVVLLSQCELQVLHEAEEKQLQSHLNLSAADADEFKWLCFDIYSARDENEEALNYLDLTKEAAEWGKQAGLVSSAKKGQLVEQREDSKENKVQIDSAGSNIVGPGEDAPGESLPHLLTSSDSSSDTSSQSDSLDFGGPLESDGVTGEIPISAQGGATVMAEKDELIKRLKPTLEDDLAPLMSLKEKEYEVLLMEGALSDLGIPSQSIEDAKRYCKDQMKSLKRKRELMEYFKPQAGSLRLPIHV